MPRGRPTAKAKATQASTHQDERTSPPTLLQSTPGTTSVGAIDSIDAQGAVAESTSTLDLPVNQALINLYAEKGEEEQQPSDGAAVIDPSLMDLERAVEQVQDRVSQVQDADAPTDLEPRADAAVEGAVQNNEINVTETEDSSGMQGTGGGVDEEMMDPDWREIVNSLTNASQSNELHSRNLQHLQSTGSTHLGEHDDRDNLHQSLQHDLEHFTQANLNALFPGQFPQSPSNNHFILPPSGPTEDQDPTQPIASSSTTTLQIPTPSHDPTQPVLPDADPNATVSGAAPVPLTDPSNFEASESNPEAPVRRGRGRPKGSKNKPNPNPKPRKPRRKKTPPPRRPRGRPKKIRTEEELAAIEEKKMNKSSGPTRKKGRPRKFPGYLVREMRLRKNREEYIQLLREYEENHPTDPDQPTPPPRRSTGRKRATGHSSSAQGIGQDNGEGEGGAPASGLDADEDEVRRALSSGGFELPDTLDEQSQLGIQMQMQMQMQMENYDWDAAQHQADHPDPDQVHDQGQLHDEQNPSGHGQSLMEAVDAAAARAAGTQVDQHGHVGSTAKDVRRTIIHLSSGDSRVAVGDDHGDAGEASEDMRRVFRLDGTDGVGLEMDEEMKE